MNLKSVIYLLIMPLLVAGTVQAQTLKGVVFEEINGSYEQAPMIKVSIEGQELSTRSDLDGNFELTLNPGTYKVQFSFAGYKTKYRELTIGENEATFVQVQMEWLTEDVMNGNAGVQQNNQNVSSNVDPFPLIEQAVESSAL